MNFENKSVGWNSVTGPYRKKRLTLVEWLAPSLLCQWVGRERTQNFLAIQWCASSFSMNSNYLLSGSQHGGYIFSLFLLLNFLFLFSLSIVAVFYSNFVSGARRCIVVSHYLYSWLCIVCILGRFEPISQWLFVWNLLYPTIIFHKDIFILKGLFEKNFHHDSSMYRFLLNYFSE